jgi:hypothetical protein
MPAHRARGQAELQEEAQPGRCGTPPGEKIMSMDAQMADLNGVQADPATPQALELRHLRYFVALADAGNFTRAAEKIFIAQPTLSQQIRRLEGIVGTPLLQRRREGLRLTPAGRALLDGSRNVLALVDQAMRRSRPRPGCRRRPQPRMWTWPGWKRLWTRSSR